MEKQEENLTSLEYFYNEALRLCIVDDFYTLKTLYKEAKEMHEDELTKAYIRGSDDAEGYN